MNNKATELSEEAKERRRAYKRAWNKANKDKVRASQIKYWEKQAKKHLDHEGE